MELRQLRYLVAVVDEGGFTRAAEKLHVAQPGVSAQIRQLERELGQPLLDRSARGVRLTEVGLAVLPYARAALEAVEGARFAVDELTGLLRGRVSVGTVVSCGALGVPDLLAAFHRAHPGVEITLSEANSDELLRRLRTGELDVAVAALAGGPPPDVEVRTLVEEPIVAAVANGDPLAERGAVPVARLARRPLISLPPGTGLRASLDEACAQARVTPKIAFEAGDPDVLADLAVRGLGVAVLPESAVRERPGELRAVAITDPPLRGRVVVAWRRGGPNGPAARAFLGHARAALAGPAPPAHSAGVTSP
ncbi:DNA-binding transcriptional LysR family regulator [Prauserella shujinwangii]|uniref:DNA-binding transcriptional LysR family regulator n=1 Tax=Prauserella shujinwangii TaxID=1453103 RepID=A0A2T0LQZ9_9PSEU|nr:LysR substrate-binding domain-containing protein [Prauserella shujinwangii]PRX45931.1 DNA-binding transcriptional LysR family regulator [Prauserella shujinwangii]